MAWAAFEIDDSFFSKGTGGIVYVPEGYYLAEGVKIEPSPEERDGSNPEDKGYQFLLWHTKIVKGPAGTIGKVLKYGPCTMKKDAQFNNGKIIHTVGMAEELEAKLKGTRIDSHKKFVGLAEALSKKFAGRKLTILVADGEPYIDKKGNRWSTSKIVDIFPAEDYEAMASATVASAAVADAPQPAKGKKAAAEEAVEAPKAAKGKAKEDIEAEVQNLFADL
jgi:hypothetical protein